MVNAQVEGQVTGKNDGRDETAIQEGQFNKYICKTDT